MRDESSARMTHFGQEWVFSPHGKTIGEPATGFCYSKYQALWEKHCVNIVFKGFGGIANDKLLGVESGICRFYVTI